MFVRKRDPRFISNTQTEAQRQAALLAASKEQAARQRAENAAKLRNYKAADWTQVSEETVEELYDSEETEAENGSDTAEEEEEEEIVIERYECIVCKKTFGSEGQMDAHERSKKHTKAVYVLKRQMEKENKEFDLDRDVRGWAKSKAEFTAIDDDEELEIEDKDDKEVEELEVENTPLPKSSSPSPTPPDDEEGDEYVTQEQFEARVLGSPQNTEDLGESLSNTLNLINDNESLKSQPAKVGKAKAKRAKRAAAETDTIDTTTCVTCKQVFPSNSKMFNHLRDNPSHAKLVTTTGGGKKGKGKGKRK